MISLTFINGKQMPPLNSMFQLYLFEEAVIWKKRLSYR